MCQTCLTIFKRYCEATIVRPKMCPACASAFKSNAVSAAPPACIYHIRSHTAAACAAGSDLFCGCAAAGTCFALAAEACGAVTHTGTGALPPAAAAGLPLAPLGMLDTVCKPCGYWPLTADASGSVNALGTSDVCMSSAMAYWNATCAVLPTDVYEATGACGYGECIDAPSLSGTHQKGHYAPERLHKGTQAWGVPFGH